ncbi:MAG: asparagine synthase (glutamine-hydrolyzing) [Betaproteobacteria bacterium]|nr:asparagine synthase (glutamine-hydrolyzing) [Betaproteobacteria bacterium]
MCGIAGVAGHDPGPHVLQAMTRALAHRGPDGEGFYRCPDRPVALGHRRLSILDHEGGAQPMSDAGGTTVVIFNGEIYNHRELRAELERLGHRFRSDHSDTEVLVHGYRQWGRELPLRLNGMFAFCVYDRTAGRLFLARDRFGKKPLYWSIAGGTLAFASELKSLLRHPGVGREIDSLGLKRYFAYGFIPAPLTLYRAIAKLPGGHRLDFDLATGAARSDAYYRFAVEPDDAMANRGEDEVAEDLRARLSAAVRRRMVADVPIGIFLSGGMDSSAIVACAARETNVDRVKTFAIGFRERSFDESGYARQMAEHAGTEHREEILDIATARENADPVMGLLDEPMGDSSIVPTFLLARFARKHVTVALGGDGGDELFAGYAPFRALGPASVYTRLVPAAIRRLVRRGVESLPSSEGYLSLDFKVKRTLRGLDYPPSAWNPAWLGPLEPAEIGELLREPASWEAVYADAIEAWESSGAPDPVGRTTEFYARFYLQDSVLAKVDRATMMVGLEARAPFLDNEVVDLARRLPTSMKCRGGKGKHILRKAMRGWVPDRLLDRPKKGFAMPLTAWLKDWEFPEPSAALSFDRAAFDGHLAAHREGRRDERLFLWCWLVLQRHLRDAPALH